MQIQIRTLDGRSLELDIEPTKTVADAKDVIKDGLGLSQSFDVVLGTRKLEDESTLVDAGVVQGDVLNVVMKDDRLLKLLQEKAKELSNDYMLGCNDLDVELVDAAVHTQLLAGKLDEWKGEHTSSGRGWKDEFSRTPFETLSAKELLAQQRWLSNALGDRVSDIGCVWKAHYSHSTPSKDWIHKWFVLELDGYVFRIHDYCFMKG
mmetsp:Transcript_131974/g.410241  ORF Transcript_131974/g.410241 Transcript_131974/m.410241 type:complete len:206 (-) Transcript_131974:96-713(-)